MKNKIIITVLIILSVFSTAASAADSFDVSAYIDYKTMEIVVNLETSIPYVQRISVIMTDSAVSNPTWEDYIRFDEFSDVYGSKTVKFILGADILSGSYKITVTASGHLSDTDSTAIEIISLDETADLLYDINNSTAADRKSVV